MEINDKYIFNKIAEGDKNAFELVFKEYYPSLLIFARRFIDNAGDAEDIVQQLFCNIWFKKDKLNINQSIRAYLFNSVRNNCYDYIKHQKVKAQYFNKVIKERNEDKGDFNNGLITRETVEAIFKAIENLPEKTKNIFKMNRFEGLKYREIAEKLEISPKTVENQMGMALKKLREALRNLYEEIRKS